MKNKFTPFATIYDLEILWRHLSSPQEQSKASELLQIVSDELRYRASIVNKDLDKMIQQSPVLKNVAKSVTCDVVARCLMTATDSEPMTQFSQSALGYTVSGSYLVPGGGLFIKKSELARLGLKKQKIGKVEMYERD
ncbi:MAG: phage Gp19/Gp15/Gp42 family protein [Bacteroidales bacterium]|nr:phage Gp19/Gp15/Gp42 family protein [Candidatus Scybalousia scybalohippi]